ncbi:G5 and 3D domain-containing protein [Paenisporosarcina sp. TG20]|uniref:G5 and 3D domain-containing protein n=1 Tax=Paenisporosarcina sp. TG20 TaxID=1211706 RepID=UPI0002E55643|nr:G5 and 3D domain-containing protein [Paenisporosarcina sp. TG20]
MSKNSILNFTKSLMNKKTGIAVLATILFISVISAMLFVGTKNTVALTINGKVLEVQTHANTVEELLYEQSIQVSEADLVSPSASTLIEDGLSVEWEEAKKVVITIDGEKQILQTTADQVSEVLAEAKVKVSEYDKLLPGLNDKIGPDATIAIEKAFEVTLVDGVNEKKIWSTSTTVADFLKQQEIQMNEFDRVEQRMDELVIPNDVIQVVRVKKVTDVVEEATGFALETRKDKNLLKGKEKVVQEGKKGLIKNTFEVTSENGKPISRVQISEEVVSEPIKRVVAVGTKVVTASVSRGTSTTTSAPAGGREFYVSATAYTAYCYGCSGITATGIDLRSNPGLKVIAVDPRIIPLGSKVWVEGYGYAIAGDTGGAIKGLKIDLFMASKDDALRFGRKQLKIKLID